MFTSVNLKIQIHFIFRDYKRDIYNLLFLITMTLLNTNSSIFLNGETIILLMIFLKKNLDIFLIENMHIDSQETL